MKLADLDPSSEFAVEEESDDEQPSSPKEPDDDNEESKERSPPKPMRDRDFPTRQDLKRQNAVAALQSLEVMALSSCFLSPAAVAYMLHSIRPYLSRPSGGVVSNSNLTLFVLAAELRPVLHFFRLVEERTLHLQRVVSSLPASDEKQLEERVADLISRFDDFEKSKETTSTTTITGNGVAEKQDLSSSTPGQSVDLERSLNAKLQPQLDALNRAVRRYEKRATTQAIVTEARLQDLEARLKDALSLAAAASRQVNQSKKGGIGGLLSQAVELVKWVLTKPLEVALLPVRLAGEAWRWLFGPRRKRRRREGKGSGAEGRKWASEFKGKR